MIEDPSSLPASMPLRPFASASAVTAPPDVGSGGGASGRNGWWSLAGLARALTILLLAAGGTSVLAAVAAARRVSATGNLHGVYVGFDDLDRARSGEGLARAALVVVGLMTLAVGAVFIVWMWRAAKNNDALGRDLPRLGAPWAIAGWFVPLANLVIPVLIVQDLWRGSTWSIGRGDMRWRIADRSALVGWWWGTWVASHVLGWAMAARAEPDTQVTVVRGSAVASLIGALLGIASAVLAVLVVRGLGARQEETLRAQQLAWRAAHSEFVETPQRAEEE